MLLQPVCAKVLFEGKTPIQPTPERQPLEKQLRAHNGGSRITE